jgi:hypothetical protein
MPIDPSDSLIDAVRFLVGDVATSPVLTDAQIQFALDQANDNTYAAAAACARALAAQYARRVDSKFETIDNKYSQLRANYEKLARSLDAQAKRAGGLGLPLAGGITTADVETAHADATRVPAFFKDSMFANPPPANE